MGKKDKKKGKGAEKTAAKTEKKLSQKLKKELAVIGEDDIEKIVAEIEEEERKQQAVTEKVVQPPSSRVNFTLTPHPDKDELIFFGGEFFNGQKTRVYNDMYFYNVQRNEWTQVKSPNGPAPRCSHQAAAISADGGQLWLFGGEFISPSQAQFYHYKDLWVYYIAQKKWEKINAPGGPTSRSGHRMVCVKKQLIVFGGFHESHQDFKYFNDLYAFSLENRCWKKLEPSGTPPAPRSGFQMFPLSDGKILIFGGYSKVKVKKDVDKGVTHTDMFLLSQEKGDTTGLKWKWSSIKPGGVRPSPRSGISAALAVPNKIFTFGGVLDKDDDDDEDLVSEFYDDLYMFETDRSVWRFVALSGKKDSSKQKRRRKKDEVQEGEEMVEEGVDNEAESSTSENMKTPMVVADDGIFTVTIRPPSPEAGNSMETSGQSNKSKVFTPSARINSGLAVKHGILYMFGGIYEDGDKQFTYADFYSLDLHKLDEWRIIIPPEDKHEWLESNSESEDDEDDDDDDDDDDEEEISENAERMDID